MGSTNNVVAISLATRGRPVMLTGTLTENALHVIELTELKPGIAGLRAKINGLTDKLASSGADITCFIEDPTGLLRGDGYQIRLDDKTHDGRPLLALALERYQALVAMGGIMFPGESDSQFKISDSIVNMKVGDNGITSYEVEWAQLKDGSRALLLLIYGAMCQSPMQVSYLARMYALLGESSHTTNPQTSFGAITSAFDQAASDKYPQRAGRNGLL